MPRIASTSTVTALIAVTALLLVGNVGAVVVNAPADASAAATTAEPGSGFDRSVVEIRVAADGSGNWTFRYEQTLASEDERDEFAAFADRFTTEETDLYQSFREDATVLVAEGNDSTEREMSAAGFDRDAYVRTSLDNDIGVVELSFVWNGFAVAEDDDIVVGDVFEGGLYVAPDQELVLRPGDDLVFASVEPEGTQSDPDSLNDSSSVTWEGEYQFTDRRPRVSFATESADAGTTEGATQSSAHDGTSPTTTSPAEGESGGWSPSVPFLVAVTVLAVVAVAWFGRGNLDSVAPLSSNGSPDDSPTEATARSAEPRSKSTELAVSPPPLEGATPSIPDEELLSDEDRIRKLLHENGGRMKQTRIVEKTGWSKSKVSVLLSEMAESDEVSKLRVGRENVISLDGHEPDVAKSPFDDE